MSKYIDWYLVELEALTKDRISRERFHDLIRETEQHLRDRSSELQGSGLSEEEADLIAIEKFGKVSRVAHLSVRTSERHSRGAGWLALSALAIFILSAVAILGFPHADMLPTLAKIGAVCGIVFCVASWFANRYLWRGILMAAVVSSIVGGVYFGTQYVGGSILLRRDGAGVQRSYLAKDVAYLRENLRQYELFEKQANATSWMGSSTTETLWHYPKNDVYLNDGAVAFGLTPDKDKAVEAFSTYSDVAMLRSRLQYLSNLLGAWSNPANYSFWPALRANVPVILMLCIQPCFWALLLNALIVGASRIKPFGSRFRRMYA